MGASQSAESRQLGREYAKRVTAQQYASMGDMNHATTFENKAAKYGYKADRTHARRFNKGKTPFPVAQHGIPAGGLPPNAGTMVGAPYAPTMTMPLASEFIAAPPTTFLQQPMQSQMLLQEAFVPAVQPLEAPIMNYQAPLMSNYSNFATPVETIVMPPQVLPPIIAPATNFW